MSRHVGYAGSLTCGPGRRYWGWVTDLTSRRERLRRKARTSPIRISPRAKARRPAVASRGGVTGIQRLEQRLAPVGTVAAHTASSRRSPGLSVKRTGRRSVRKEPCNRLIRSVGRPRSGGTPP